MTEKDLIQKLQELKQIKPSQDWVTLAKSEIFNKGTIYTPVVRGAIFSGLFSQISGLMIQRKLAYSLAVFLFMIVGVSTVIQFNLVPIGNFSQNVAMSEDDLKINVESFKVKSQTLAQASLDKANTALALNEVKNTAKELTSAIKKDPQLAKKVALDINNNKTLLDISGSNSVDEVSSMYKTIVVSLIKDLNERTLAQDQVLELKRIKNYIADTDDYATALRDILLLSLVSESR